MYTAFEHPNNSQGNTGHQGSQQGSTQYFLPPATANFSQGFSEKPFQNTSNTAGNMNINNMNNMNNMNTNVNNMNNMNYTNNTNNNTYYTNNTNNNMNNNMGNDLAPRRSYSMMPGSFINRNPQPRAQAQFDLPNGGPNRNYSPPPSFRPQYAEKDIRMPQTTAPANYANNFSTQSKSPPKATLSQTFTFNTQRTNSKLNNQNYMQGQHSPSQFGRQNAQLQKTFSVSPSPPSRESELPFNQMSSTMRYHYLPPQSTQNEKILTQTSSQIRQSPSPGSFIRKSTFLPPYLPLSAFNKSSQSPPSQVPKSTQNETPLNQVSTNNVRSSQNSFKNVPRQSSFGNTPNNHKIPQQILIGSTSNYFQQPPPQSIQKETPLSQGPVNNQPPPSPSKSLFGNSSPSPPPPQFSQQSKPNQDIQKEKPLIQDMQKETPLIQDTLNNQPSQSLFRNSSSSPPPQFSQQSKPNQDIQKETPLINTNQDMQKETPLNQDSLNNQPPPPQSLFRNPSPSPSPLQFSQQSKPNQDIQKETPLIQDMQKETPLSQDTPNNQPPPPQNLFRNPSPPPPPPQFSQQNKPVQDIQKETPLIQDIQKETPLIQDPLNNQPPPPQSLFRNPSPPPPPPQFSQQNKPDQDVLMETPIINTNQDMQKETPLIQDPLNNQPPPPPQNFQQPPPQNSFGNMAQNSLFQQQSQFNQDTSMETPLIQGPLNNQPPPPSQNFQQLPPQNSFGNMAQNSLFQQSPPQQVNFVTNMNYPDNPDYIELNTIYDRGRNNKLANGYDRNAEWTMESVNEVSPYSNSDMLYEKNRAAIIFKPWDYFSYISFSKKNPQCLKCLRIIAAMFTTNYLKKIQIKQKYTPANSTGNNSFLAFIDQPNSMSCNTITYDTIANINPLQTQHGQNTDIQIQVTDCLDYVHKAQREGGKVACLIFGHPMIPGGGWKEGKIGQEEDVFIRSTISSNFSRGGYLLEENTAMYSKDVSVFRANEKCGFAFYDMGSAWALDIVAIAGIGHTTPITSKVAIDLAVRLEIALSACIENNVQQLVIGWVDTNTDTKLTTAVASILREVLCHFVGLFTRVTIVVKTQEDKQAITENFFAIDKKFSSYKCLGSYTGPSIDEYKKPVCHEGGLCTRIDPGHYANKKHPQLCPLGDQCMSKDKFHRLLFMHRRQCPNGGCCALMYAKDNSLTVEHEKLFNHPPKCSNGVCCNDITEEHVTGMLHPPPCILGASCPHVSDKSHFQSWRHNMMVCKDGTKCTKVFDNVHNWIFWHNHMPICSDTPWECTNTDREHLSNHAHVCKFGPYCEHIGNPEHEKNFVHGGEKCTDSNCNNLTEEHLGKYFHKDYWPFRQQCTDLTCTNTGRPHRYSKSHSPWGIPECAVHMLTCRSPVPRNNSLEDDFMHSLHFRADFHKNSTELINTLDVYLGKDLSKTSKDYTKITQWVNSLRPTIACSENEAIFALKLGFFASPAVVKFLLESGDNIADVAIRHNRVIRDVARTSPDHAMWIHMYAAACASLYLSELNPSVTEREAVRWAKEELEKEFNIDGGAVNNEIREIVEALREISGASPYSSSPQFPNNNNNNNTSFNPLTDNAVIGVLGPHMGYGNGDPDVIFVLRPGIMYHPDFFVLPASAALYTTSEYRSKRKNWTGSNKNWDKTDAMWRSNANRDFLIDRLSPADPLFVNAVSKELIARTLEKFPGRKKAPNAVTLEDIIRSYWEKEDTSYLFEAHLPQVTPLDCVEYAIISKTKGGNMSDKLKGANIDVHFANSTVNGCVAELSSISAGMPQLLVPQGFHFAVTGTSEHHIPITLDEDAESVEVSFRAYCRDSGNLCITLSNVGDTKCSSSERRCITFVLNGNGRNVALFKNLPSECVLAAAPEPEDMCYHFNNGCPFRGFIEYKIVANYENKKVTFSHNEGSAIYNDLSVSTSISVPTRYSYISFSTTDDGAYAPVVTDLKTTASGNGGYKAIFPPACDIPQYHTFKSTPYIQAPSSTPNKFRSHKQRHANSHTNTFKSNNMPNWIDNDDDDDDDDDDNMGINNNGRLPLCDDPFSCPILSNDPCAPHKSEKAHICRKGITCPKINDMDHRREFYHLEKEICPDGDSCRSLNDPEHRLVYSHPYKQDYLIKCRYGAKCYYKNDYEHCMSYHHDPTFTYNINTLKFKEFTN